MAKYKTVPAEVDARQYTGGEKNGKTLEAWVNSLGGNAKWTPSNTYQCSEGFNDLTLPEEFCLGPSELHMEWNIMQGQWLVFHEDFITIYSDAVFKNKFEKA
jgi:hypothetical protein